MFWDETAPHFSLGRYLGLSIDIGPTLMANNIKEKCQVLHRSKFHALSQDEWEQEECKLKCSSFMESLYQRLVPHSMVRDLVELGAEDTAVWSIWGWIARCWNVPHYGWKQQITPEWGGQDVNTETLPPKRGQSGKRLGRIDPHCGRRYPILRSCTQSRLLNMP